LELISS